LSTTIHCRRRVLLPVLLAAQQPVLMYIYIRLYG
jgi:hypothetical protein